MRWSWSALFTHAIPICAPVTTLPTDLLDPSPSSCGVGSLAITMVRSRKVVRGETRQDRVLERSHLGPLAGMLVSPRMRQQYASAVWYFELCCVNLFGTVSEDLSVLDRQVTYFLQLIWAEGEAKSLAAHTICGLQHFLNVRRAFSRVLEALRCMGQGGDPSACTSAACQRGARNCWLARGTRRTRGRSPFGDLVQLFSTHRRIAFSTTCARQVCRLSSPRCVASSLDQVRRKEWCTRKCCFHRSTRLQGP